MPRLVMAVIAETCYEVLILTQIYIKMFVLGREKRR